MSRHIRKKSSAPGYHHGKVSAVVRNIITSLAIPSVLTACAPAPHIDSNLGHLAGANRNTILFVKPRSKHAGEEQAEPGEPENDAETSSSSFSPANKYIPVPSDIPIFEKLLSKYRISDGIQTPEPKGQTLVVGKHQTPQPIKLSPPLSIKSLQDGIWDRMRKRLMLTAIEHESVRAEVDKIRRSPGAVNFLSKRAEPFLFYIVDEIERRGLPMDLAMVPMVESAFDANAISPKDAAGIWQIIPGTAVENGLKLAAGYDGRYDVYASTKAALKHLSRLQGLFGGDWLLALAAYNAGEGAVQRAIQANQKAGRGTEFWQLDLPAETKAYVPKILALSRVVADPDAHGLKLRKISPLPYLARVEVNSSAPLAQAVASTGMNWEEFNGLNPAFKPDVTPSPPFNVLLPLEKAQVLAANLPGAKLMAVRKYVVKQGETLSVIAKKEGVPPLKLAEWNGLKSGSRVRPGQELVILPV